jgi:hypothetical protein
MAGKLCSWGVSVEVLSVEVRMRERFFPFAAWPLARWPMAMATTVVIKLSNELRPLSGL